MYNISRKTLKFIEEREVTPQPRWHFLARDCTLWCLLAFLVVLEVIIVETMLYIFFDRYWDIYPFLGMGFLGYLFMSLPYFWMILFFGVGWVVHQNVSRMRTGYRYPFYAILTGSVVGSMTIGSLLVYGGVIIEMHGLFTEQVPLYGRLVYSKEDIWDNADTGLLGGEITEEVKQGEAFMLKDFKGRNWKIGKELAEPNIENFRKGSKVSLIGKKEGEDMFYAQDVRPWERLVYMAP